MAYNEATAARVRDLTRDHRGISERKMFGGVAFMVDEHMFIGVLGEALMARIGPAAHAQALTQPHVRPMDFTGKPMTGYVFVDPPGFASDAALAAWINASYEHATALPAKKPKR